MSRISRRGTARTILVGAATAAIALAGAVPADAHSDDGDGQRATALTAGVPIPIVTSGKVHLVTTVPDSLGISGDYSRSTEHFYMSTLNGVSVFDISNPLQPVLKGQYQNEQFENEAMNYGERRKNGVVKRQFVLVGLDLYGAEATDPTHINVRGGQVILVDVTDPNNPHDAARIPATTSTHTVTCVHETQCRFAYTAGSRGFFSVIDLRHLGNPQEVDSKPATAEIDPFPSPAAGPNSVFTRGAGHHWDFNLAGKGFHTGSGGSAAFDVSDPMHPRLLTTTGGPGRGEAPYRDWNNFIHHNSWNPHANQFVAGARPRLYNGNVLLVTEEDYEQTDCSLAGSFQTWRIARYGGSNSAITPLDKVELADLGGPLDFTPPQDAFCSAHWFDYHQSGIAAVAYYGGGIRLVDVRDPKNIKSYGYAVGGETWDAYWLPKRLESGVARNGRTSIMYGVDFLTGLSVYKVDLPSGNAGRR